MRTNLEKMARPAIILAGVRTGGTFLAHCLSNHPRIFCDRGESLNGKHIWYQVLRPDSIRILSCMTRLPHYHVSMCKVTLGQATLPGVWEYIKLHVPTVIFLARRNVVHQAVSLCINNVAKDRPAHSMVPLPAVNVAIDPQIVVETIRQMTKEASAMRARLAEIPHTLEIYYEDLAGTEGQIAGMNVTYLNQVTGKNICEFLDVPVMPLFSELRKVNPQPLEEIISNWAEVRAAVEKTTTNLGRNE